MTKRVAIRKTPTPEQEAHIAAAIAEEKLFAEETKAQCREVLAELRAMRSTVDTLRAERERQGLSLAEVESRTGMTRSAISKLENHHVKNPTLLTLLRYASALGMQFQVNVTKADR
ncbi:helix-turn-helix domain-containing protein [Botrimarina mediterranea]|uniref:Helix-turn-helix protein n=1 Tax=Botrimarina mediterranea TaxID=2528022 RepID=A0A518K569_9BACT|nr:helix-turn-helix transcriptional regulator [Botrimarina mediterranea]QDV72941.1 helix-turn-helix protein [Botrimarina mediterranea]QDV77515.1 helix-turn-helix protein [Planctomycetes bacterium K2D]